MAANSKHWADVLQWLYKIIDSCTTIHHILAAKRLCRLYIKKYPYKKWGDKMSITHEVLIGYCDYKFEELKK
jgi:hypothetical protein